MKKTYMIPETEVVDIKMQHALLAGSGLSINEEEVSDPENLLAPGMTLPGVEIPGLPSFVFE